LIDIYFIHGYYKSGIHLTRDALITCKASAIEWPESLKKAEKPTGKEITENDISSLLSVLDKKQEPSFIFGNLSANSLNSLKALNEITTYNVHHVVIYRPLEQIVDSITRQRIKDIYLNKKAIGRIFTMRKFQKSLPQLQQSIKSEYIAYYKGIMNRLIDDNSKVLVIQTGNFKASITDFVQIVNTNSGSQYPIEMIEEFYDSDKFIQQKSIDSYRDSSLNEIHSFFKK
jgi:hypothetical protein